VRPRSDSIGSLGRAPARAIPPTLKTPPPPPEPERSRLRAWIHGALFDNIGLKFLSIVLAITVFLLVNTDRDHRISARVGVVYTLPDDKVLLSDRIEDVRITIEGPWQRLRQFDEREIPPINLDVGRPTTGEMEITNDMVHLPSGLTVTSITPRSVPIEFDRRIDKIVEVSPKLSGRPQHGYEVAEAKAAPATIGVRGAASTVGALSAVKTHEVSVEGRTESFTYETTLDLPDHVDSDASPQVVVNVTIDEKLVTTKVPGLAVAVRGDGIDASRWSVTPAQVEVTLTGTQLAVDKGKAALLPIVKVSGNDTRTRDADVVVEGLPPGIGVKISPERVKVGLGR
jgi:YbbR domain-containing protein